VLRQHTFSAVQTGRSFRGVFVRMLVLSPRWALPPTDSMERSSSSEEHTYLGKRFSLCYGTLCRVRNSPHWSLSRTNDSVMFIELYLRTLTGSNHLPIRYVPWPVLTNSYQLIRTSACIVNCNMLRTARSLRHELCPWVILHWSECCTTQGHSSCPTEQTVQLRILNALMTEAVRTSETSVNI
jgi:hypothetical protein